MAEINDNDCINYYNSVNSIENEWHNMYIKSRYRL